MPAHKKPRLNKTCELCGRLFQTMKQVRRFCSKKCSGQHVAHVRKPKPKLSREQVLSKFWSLVKKQPGCWLWLGKGLPSGYGRFRINSEEHYAHRFSYEQKFGKVETGFYVCHKCDNPACVKPGHLFLGTPQDNVDDMWEKGRAVSRPKGYNKGVPHPTPEKMLGDLNGNAKLTEDDVRYIRAHYHRASYKRSNTKALAKQFQISENAVLHIISRKRWSHVD